ncbi:MAG: hypothetical protein KA123_01575 [Candidatus Eisenbacteria bacterium]|nr:hypothetical protein [Candidatus Eisenbacteria bacterium]
MKLARIVLFLGVFLALGMGSASAVETTIYNVQTGMHPEGTLVTLRNCVVTGTGFWGFFIQVPEANHHPSYGYQYSGIWVYSGNLHLGKVRRGDLVNVTGYVDEYFDFTEVDIAHAPCTPTTCSFTVTGTAPVPTPVTVDISSVNLPTAPLAEAYESVLIRVDDDDTSLYAGEMNNYDEWYARTNLAHATGDSILVDHKSADPEGDFDYAQPDENQLLTFVQGVLDYNYDQFKIDPRNCPEDLGMGCAPELRAAWAVDNTHVDVLFAVDVEEESSESIYNYYIDSGLSVTNAQRDDSNHRLVHLTTAPQTPGIIDIIYVEAVFSEGGIEMDQADFTFTQGITPIYTLQYVPDLLSDASAYRDVVVTTTGRVTGLDGRYYFLQQGDAGPFKHLYSRVSAVGDLAVGDSVIVAGRITEYYDHETELSYQSGVQGYRNLGPAQDDVIVTELNAHDLLYDAFPNDLNPPDDNAPEPWEHALVKIRQPCYLDSVPGEAALYGEWWLDPGTGTPPDTCRSDFLHEMNEYGETLRFIPTQGDSIRLTGIVRFEYNIYRVIPLERDHIEMLYYGGSVNDPGQAYGLRLSPNRPNPFRANTQFRFHLEEDAASVQVTIFDVTGAVVRHLVSGKAMRAGEHNLSWDGANDDGAPCSSGAYFYRLDVDGRSESRSMIRLD